jgi:hypothetical protein
MTVATCIRAAALVVVVPLTVIVRGIVRTIGRLS